MLLNCQNGDELLLRLSKPGCLDGGTLHLCPTYHKNREIFSGKYFAVRIYSNEKIILQVKLY